MYSFYIKKLELKVSTFFQIIKYTSRSIGTIYKKNCVIYYSFSNNNTFYLKISL